MNQIVEIDARGKPCPMPLLLLKRAMKKADQQHFHLLASDPHSVIDIVRYCELNQITCRLEHKSANEYHYFIES